MGNKSIGFYDAAKKSTEDIAKDISGKINALENQPKESDIGDFVQTEANSMEPPRRDVLCTAEEIYVYEGDGIVYFVMPFDADILCVTKGRGWWTRSSESFWWAQDLGSKFYRPASFEEAMALVESWQLAEKSVTPEYELLHEAILFAEEAHRGQKRKGTDIDYISHPMEVLQILTAMEADLQVQIAGVLHDTLEDTKVKPEDIRDRFGDEVLELVLSHTEKDKSKSWKDRKVEALEALKASDFRVKELVLADKVSNMRSIASDFHKVGNKLWDRFNAGKKDISWYYSEGIDALDDMMGMEGPEYFYWELNSLYKDVFVTNIYDEQKEILYQCAAHGEYVYRKKTGLNWYPLKQCPDFSGMQILHRWEAEVLENEWDAEPENVCDKESEACIEADLQDRRYPVYSGKGRSFDISVEQGKLSLDCEDWGDSCEVMNGKDEYEFQYNLDEANTKKFLTAFREKYGQDIELGALLAYVFGEDGGPVIFKEFLESHHIQYGFFSY